MRPLGKGGMSTLWVAQQIVLEIPVALKLLYLGDEEAEAGAAHRMLEEARTAARMAHAAVVRVHDYDLTSLGDPFIVLELLEGEDLADLLARRRKLGKFEAVSILLPIAHALSAAHDRGIVHRDVKPENIFLARSHLGIQPKLLDFGVARLLDRASKIGPERTLLGTPEYMSPEQARGETAAASADLWSLSVVLYELLTGRCPFRGSDSPSLLRCILEQDPPSILVQGVEDPELWALLRRGLEKDPSHRHPSMRAWGQALARWMLDSGISEDLAGTSLRRSWLAYGGSYDPLSVTFSGFRDSRPVSPARAGENPMAVRYPEAGPTQGRRLLIIAVACGGLLFFLVVLLLATHLGR